MFNHITPAKPFIDLETTTIDGSRWYVSPDGTFPSVTTVLSRGEKPWLEAWRNRIGHENATQETERAAARGTAIHEMCEQYLLNTDVQEIRTGKHAIQVRLFNQIRMALVKSVDNIRAQEVALWSKTLRLAGRTDCIAEYHGKLSIIDFKTSKRVKGEDYIQDYFLQSTAYALMYNEMFNENIEDIVIIITSEDGLMPTVFTKKIAPYIAPLMERIEKFNSEQT